MNEQNNRTDISSLRIDKTKKYQDRPRSKKWLWWLIGIVAAIVVVIAYTQFKESVASATSVRTARAQMLRGSDAAAELVATGYVVAQRKAEVASKGTGRLVYLGFEEGDRVSSGEIIAQIDNDDIQAALEVAKAQLRQTEVDTLNAGRQYRRQQDLFRSGGITDVILENAEAAYMNALALAQAAQANVRVQEVNLENTYVRAPFDGTILTKNADVGEVVAPFASSSSSKGSVVTMADMASLEVEADVSEAYIYKVSVGQRCEIILDAYSGFPYQGYVKKIVPTADRARATVLTKIAFDNIDERVLPEMSARINFFLAGKEKAEEIEALVVPNNAITNRDGHKIVFRVEGEYVSAVSIEIGRKLGSVTEVLSGLEDGNEVVVSPPGKMESGQKIERSK